MGKFSKAIEKFEKEHNLTSTEYLYLKAARKSQAEIKKRPNHADQTAQDPKHSTARIAQSDLARTRKVQSARPSAKAPSPGHVDALKSKDPVRSNKKPLVSAQGQPAKTKSAPAKKKSAAPIRKKDIDYQSAKPSIPEPDDSLPEFLPLYDEHKIDKNLVSIVKPHSFETDLFKVLRGKILFPVSGKPPRSILVTSAVPGEGKSFITSNLAVNLAQNIAEYVLLVDCDLRRSTIHKLFGFGQVKGLSDHLSDGAGLSNLLLKTVVDKLTLLPAGQPPLNPSEILSSAKMADLIDELKSRYDDRYLIFDSPPPMLAPETTAIAKRVDGIIVVIKYGDTSIKLIEQMIHDLGSEKIIGAVINRVDTQTAGYFRGYKKYRKYY